MKIVHIVHGKVNPTGHNGISLVVYNMNKYEKLRGIDSQIWAIVDGVKKHHTYERDKYVTVECYPRVWNPFSSHEIINELIKQKDKIDLVHFHLIWFYDKNIIAKALKKEGIPFIITTHGSYSNRSAYTGKPLLAWKLYELDYLKMATEIHVITREEGTRLQAYGYHGRSFVAYNGADLERIPKNRKNDFFINKPYKDKLKIGWVGVLREEKNLKSLIHAVSFLPDEIKNTFVCILIGPNYKNKLEQYVELIKKYGCEKNFDFVGPLYGQEKYDAIESLNAYVMPSFNEAFSIATLDAMACAKPCIVTSGCGFNYVLTDDFGVVCEPYPQDISRSIEYLLDHQELWETWGSNARSLIDNKLNWSSIVDVMIENYLRIIGAST